MYCMQAMVLWCMVFFFLGNIGVPLSLQAMGHVREALDTRSQALMHIAVDVIMMLINVCLFW
jgi:hypothetical protein